MDSDEFEAVVDAIVGELPEWVRGNLHNIEILVSDRPTADLLDGLEADDTGEDLLGLYVGTPLTERGANDGGMLPDVIHIFRLPHLSLGLDHEALREEIRVTVMHEVAHYFGIDDDHLDEIGFG